MLLHEVYDHAMLAFDPLNDCSRITQLVARDCYINVRAHVKQQCSCS